MRLKFKILMALLPKEVKDMITKILDALNGRKTLIGIVIGLVPQLIDAVNQVLAANGSSPEAWAKISGGILMLVGLLHKFMKDAPAK